jgi:hypothetical protein
VIVQGDAKIVWTEEREDGKQIELSGIVYF